VGSALQRSLGVVARDGALAASIDVSGAGGRGNPYASGIRIIDAGSGPKAFVPLEKLEWISGRLSPTRPSSMLRIDARTLVVEAEVPLVGRNPFNAPGAFAQSEGMFFLAEPGDFLRADEDDAGIERFDPATSSARLLVREADLGGNAVEVAVSERCGAVLLADSSADNRVSLAMVDAESGAVLARDLAGPSASFDAGLRGIAWVRSGRVLLAGDRTRTERGYPIHAFSRDDACRLTKLDDRIFVSQPPLSLAGATD
jgi:hypothetical protein